MKNGKRIVLARRITLTAVFVAVLASLAFDSGIGTPSSFGIGEFFLLCPLGGIEAMLASASFIPSAAISLAIVLAFALIFGRAWCAWGCPAPTIRKFFRRQPESEAQAAEQASAGCGGCTSQEKGGHGRDDVDNNGRSDSGKRSIFAAITSYIASDRRLWVLFGVLIVTIIVGFPIFCLVCPIGLTFGTVSSLWHLIVDKQVTASVIVFPLALAIELIVYRKWCVNLCPIAGLLNVFGHFAKLFRPRIKAETCLRYVGKECNVCVGVCAENINMHTSDAPEKLGECTRCGECVKMCPTNSISIETKPSDPVVRR